VEAERANKDPKEEGEGEEEEEEVDKTIKK